MPAARATRLRPLLVLALRSAGASTLTVVASLAHLFLAALASGCLPAPPGPESTPEAPGAARLRPVLAGVTSYTAMDSPGWAALGANAVRVLAQPAIGPDGYSLLAARDDVSARVREAQGQGWQVILSLDLWGPAADPDFAVARGRAQHLEDAAALAREGAELAQELGVEAYVPYVEPGTWIQQYWGPLPGGRAEFVGAWLDAVSPDLQDRFDGTLATLLYPVDEAWDLEGWTIGIGLHHDDSGLAPFEAYAEDALAGVAAAAERSGSPWFVGKAQVFHRPSTDGTDSGQQQHAYYQAMFDSYRDHADARALGFVVAGDLPGSEWTEQSRAVIAGFFAELTR